jgi:hypothetical protein
LSSFGGFEVQFTVELLTKIGAVDVPVQKFESGPLAWAAIGADRHSASVATVSRIVVFTGLLPR